MCELAAIQLKIDPDEVIVASTGVIGQSLNIEPIENSIAELAEKLSENGSDMAANAILTTDTVKKEFAVEVIIDNKAVRLGGICKGSGMINPNMATMLGFITTDANISDQMLKKALKNVCDKTFNCVSVDGDTSTNDMVSILANGDAGNTFIDTPDGDYEIFEGALLAVQPVYQRAIAKDGEGATKLLECVVVNAESEIAQESLPSRS
jgi:glutamate N-acetyltransferase/amino-acid N-acetyltransferase